LKIIISGWGGKVGKDLKRIMSGMERRYEFEEKNKWGGKAGKDL
jgi:hypothetical protein